MRIKNRLSTSRWATTVLFAATLGVSAPTALAKPGAASQARMVESYGKLPLSFEPNHGQTDPRVKFLSRGRGYTLFLTSTEAVLTLRKAAQLNPQHNVDVMPSFEATDAQALAPAVIRMELVGGNPAPRVVGFEELPGKSNYFIGNDHKKWRTNIPHYAKVKYEEVYPGIDLVYYSNRGQLEYDFTVAPGANPKAITIGVVGANGVRPSLGGRRPPLRIDTNGDLVLPTDAGEIRFHKPVAYQVGAGLARPKEGAASSAPTVGGKYFLESRYVITENNRVAFEVAPYDASQPLIIDPVLKYSTYLGGGGADRGFDIVVDSSGNAYVTGATNSNDFPTTVGGFQDTITGDPCCGGDVFVTKLNASGSALVYSTYLGGSGTGGDTGTSVAVDAQGNAYVTGATNSNDFPTAGAFQTTSGGSTDAFVTKLNAAGSALVYSTYLGGSFTDSGSDVAVDAGGSAYVVGRTFSTDFPTTAGAFQTAPGAPLTNDAFVTRFSAAGNALVYSSYLGGSGTDGGFGIAVDSAGNAYVAGNTSSADFPTAIPVQATNGGGFDAFVTKLEPTGSTLTYSTYLGGSGNDAGLGIAVDGSVHAYVMGQTFSSDFPTTVGSFQTDSGGSLDACVTKFNPAGTALVYSTYLGGSGIDGGSEFGPGGIDVDAEGNAYVTGRTISTDFPTANPFQSDLGGSLDAYVTKLNPAGTALVYSTYLGGNASDQSLGIAVDASGNAYVVGITGSGDFPTVNPFQSQNAVVSNAFDTFVAKIGEPNQLPVAFCQDVIVSADANCQADADVDNGSFDPDEDPITLEQSPAGPYGLGTTLVTLTVTDDQGASASCLATVTVEDTTPPQLSVTVDPDTLWPPNHHMVDVEATVIASDNCDTAAVVLTSVSSNEADDGLGIGDGRTTDDIQLGADDFHFSLRAERAGTGSGRIYTAIYTATDGAGNAASETGFVVVSHDRNGVIDPVKIAAAQTASGTVIFWPAVSGAESYDVIRGELNNIVETGVVINLGTVLCIEANSINENTLGWEDGALPEPGQAFFYVVEYYDGISSTYGTESAGKPRAPGLGDCQ